MIARSLAALALCLAVSAADAAPGDIPVYTSGPRWTTGRYAGAGTTVTDATQITTPIAIISSAANNSGVKLPSCTSATLGQIVYVVIPAALTGTLKIYPSDLDAWWNGGAAGTSFSVASSTEGTSAFVFVCISGGLWMPARVSHIDAATTSAASIYNLAVAGGISLTSTATITFGGATGANKLALTDNLASALDVTESTNSYLKFVTTNGAEVITHSKPIKPLIATPVAAAGTTIADCGAIPAGTVAVQITDADATKGACLPTTASVTTCVRLMNQSASVLKVYGADADTSPTVNGGAGDAAYSMAAGVSLLFCNSGVAWTSY